MQQQCHEQTKTSQAKATH